MGGQILQIEEAAGVRTLWLNRPDAKNALNPELVAALSCAFEELAAAGSAGVRAAVLRGRGGFFCSGADLRWMLAAQSFGPDENYADALRLGKLFELAAAAPCPLIGVVEGGAFGGGLGLLCCCDYVLSANTARFAFSEVRLGIAPATIAPYALARLGLTAARELMISGSLFDAQRGLACGLLTAACEPGGLDSELADFCGELLKAGPLAARATKRLLLDLHGLPGREVRESAARQIADLRAGPEGQEGLSAFLEKRSPGWLA